MANPLKYYDTLFTWAYCFYLNTKDNTPAVLALCLVAIIQLFHLTSAALLFVYTFHIKFTTHKYYGAILFFVLLALGYYRYFVIKDRDALAETLTAQSKDKRKNQSILLVISIILSVVIGLYLAVTIGKMNKNW